MVYLIVFVLCLCADYYRNFRILSILIIYIILCFGYTTGTDWISYELYYKYGIENAHFATREPGLGVLINLANYFTSDFWIFNGFCKVFYLWTLTRMISFFTHRVWSVVALTLIFFNDVHIDKLSNAIYAGMFLTIFRNLYDYEKKKSIC